MKKFTDSHGDIKPAAPPHAEHDWGGDSGGEWGGFFFFFFHLRHFVMKSGYFPDPSSWDWSGSCTTAEHGQAIKGENAAAGSQHLGPALEKAEDVAIWPALENGKDFLPHPFPGHI